MNSNTTTATKSPQDLSAANIFNQLLHHLSVPPFAKYLEILLST